MKRASIFEFDGVPSITEALPLAFQHVLAMIAGCIAPAIIVANMALLSPSDSTLLIQSALVIAALTTLLQLFPIGRKNGFHIGAKLPVIMGISFAYVPSMQAIAVDSGVPAILGAQIVGGIVAIIVGLSVKKIQKFFPPLITGTVVFTIGLSLYPVAVNYMAGGIGSPTYGAPLNWGIAILTLAVVTAFNHFAKGIAKLSSILIGMTVGYIAALFCGIVDFSPIAEASLFSLPKPLHFGVNFEAAPCIAIGLLFAINSIQAIGDFTATTSGAMNRFPTDEELKGGIVGYGTANIFGALIGGLPTASFSQNVGIVTTTKVINRCVLGLAALILLTAGIVPKVSALLTTIPLCVLGGATISVFASISMTGLRLIDKEKSDYRNSSIVGLSVALGMGIYQYKQALALFPAWTTTIFGNSPVVVATIMAIFLNIILPKQKGSN